MEEAQPDVVQPQLANIREEWHWVKPGIEEILHLDPYLKFRPEDVYHSVLSGESHLWTHPDFFVVTTFETDVFSGDKTFLIWLSWSRTKGLGNAAKHFTFFEGVAEQSGCQEIQVRTAHQRVGEYIEQDLGWKCRDRIFGKDL
jgi:hypothetical protein